MAPRTTAKQLGPRLSCPEPGCDYQTKAGSNRAPEFILKAHVRMKHPDAESGGEEPGSSSSASGNSEGPPPDPAPDQLDPGEAPSRHKTTVRDVFAKLRRPKEPKVEPSSTGEKAPRSAKWGKQRRGRTPVGPLFESVYGALGRKLELGGGPNVAVGRTLTFQAPIAASRADDMVKGTLVDRFVQPAAKLYDTGEDAFAIAGLPVLVWAWQTFPDARRALNMPMRAAILANLEELVPAMEKAAKREAELQAKVTQLAPMLFPDGMPTDGDGKPLDLVSAMLGNIFGGVETGATIDEGATNNGNTGPGGDGGPAEGASRVGGAGEAA